MSMPLTVWFLLALTLFWSVGMYNRVMRLRARVVNHMAEFEVVVRQWAGMLQANIEQAEENDVLSGLRNSRTDCNGILSHLEAFLEDKCDPFAARKLLLLEELAIQIGACQSRSSTRPMDDWGQVHSETTQEQALCVQVRVRITDLQLDLLHYSDAVLQIPAKWVAALFGFKVTVVGK